MKLLWTISNWKRTGPVGPSLDLAKAVAQRGHDVRVEVGRPVPGDPNTSARARADRDLRPAGVGARLHKHAFFLRDRPDVAKLARWMRDERPDVVVTTLPNDHRLALAAARRADGVQVVRLWFHDGVGEFSARDATSLEQTARVFVFGESPARRLRSMGISEDRVHVLGAPLDVEGLRSRAALNDGTSPLTLPAGRFVFGIVARIQPHRRWELLWDALVRLRDARLPFHLVVLGRGTNQELVAHRPVQELGLSDYVTFAGYLTGDAYARALTAFDAQLLLVPGSDPTCRALREGMALGIPSVACPHGLLPVLVEAGETGYLFNETAESLAEVMTELAADPARTRRMGRAARRRADRFFAADRVAEHFLAALGDASA